MQSITNVPFELMKIFEGNPGLNDSFVMCSLIMRSIANVLFELIKIFEYNAC